MRPRDIIISVVCVVLAVGLLITAGMRLDYINSQRAQMKLIINEPLENAPPSLAFATVAMGAFRGLVVDILWMRADKLKEEGQFFDARQLAEWITMLQPRFAAVWEFHAWNMAYNISVALPATQPDQRWRWVKNGYELLRDQGIPLNPKALKLHRELARIFQHKIGGVSDDAHKYYKLQLALAMEPLLRSEDNQLDWQDDRYFEALAAAPDTWEDIVKDPNVGELIAALKSADKAFRDDDTFVSNYLSLRQKPKRFSPAAFETIDRFRGTPALKKFDIFARAYQLRNAWKLDPVLMRELNRTYGPTEFDEPNRHFPLDWRHPDSHAIYWGVKGLQQVSKDTDREIDISETNTDRIVAHSLQNLFRYGKIFIYDVPVQVQADSAAEPEQKTAKEIYLRPDLNMFQSYNQAMLAILQKYKSDKDEGSYKSLQDGHRNMLKNACFLFYQAGHEQPARKIYDELRKRYPRDEFNVPLVVFASRRFREELESLGIYDAEEQIVALLRESYFRYALRDDNEAFGREKLAQQVWDYYMSKYDDPEYRVDLPDMKLLRYFALWDFLNDPLYPPNLRSNLLGRMKIERPDRYEQLKGQEEQLMKKLEQSQ
jgi:hypothetical protein